MREFRSTRPLTYLLLAFLTASCACAPKDGNGIYVDGAKVYDNHTLQLQLLTLSGRIGQLSGVDQNSLISRLGTIQGASSTQYSAALQANGVPMPGLATTSTSGTPSIAQTVGATTSSGTPQIVQTLGGSTSTGTSGSSTTSSNQTVTTTPTNTNGTTNQTVTTTPSNTVQTVSTAPAVTPAPPPLPSTVSFTLPSAYSVSSLDTLNEEMQLSYQMINLQLLLQGSLDDDYTTGGWGKRHVTLGFPVSISTPPYYRGDVAEVEVSVCNPETTAFNASPRLQTIIPQEKTYNVASLVSSSAQLGAGAVIGGVVNVGGSFLWIHQTYYLVKEQDTVALQRGSGRSSGTCPGAAALPPVTFAWQFRPVLGQETIQQGLRWTFAQISLAPSSLPADNTLESQVTITTCWRSYDRKAGIAGDIIPKSCETRKREISTYYDTTEVSGIDQTDNGDGSLTVKVIGTFPAGTSVGLGDVSLNDSSLGFQNTGTYLRFTAPNQLIASRGARLISPDGSQNEIVLNSDLSGPSDYTPSSNKVFVPGNFPAATMLMDHGTMLNPDSVVGGISFDKPNHFAHSESSLTIIRPDGTRCSLPSQQPPGSERTARVAPYNGNVDEVTVPLWQCIEVGPTQGGPYTPVVVLGGKAFGLSDAPFKSFSKNELTFLAPDALLQGQTTLELKRLFLDRPYETTYRLPFIDTVPYAGISILESSKTGATFAITGSGLANANFTFPENLEVKKRSDTSVWFSLKTTDLLSVKQVILKLPKRAPIFIPLPAVTKPSDDTKFSIAILESSKDKTTFAITGNKGSMLQAAAFLLPTGLKPIQSDDTDLWFSLTADQLTSIKQIAIQLPASAPTIIAVPALPKEGGETSAKAVLKADSTGIATGSTAPYKIAGSNLQLISSIRYLGKPLPFSRSKDNTSVTLAPFPTALVATPGIVGLQIRFNDGTTQQYDVTINTTVAQ